MGAAIIALIYMFVTAACVGMATYSTYFGYLSLLDVVALPFALVIALGLLACDIAILRQRRDGLPVRWIVMMLLLLTALSAGSNFNYFYTNFMRDTIVSARLQLADRDFDANTRAALNAIDKETRPFREATAEINRILNILSSEVTDPRNEGWGTRAQANLKEIYDRLSRLNERVQEGKLPPPKAARKENEAALEIIKGKVGASLMAAEKANPFLRVSDRIEAAKRRQAEQSKAQNSPSPSSLVNYQTSPAFSRPVV
jgi:hypothetical protein